MGNIGNGSGNINRFSERGNAMILKSFTNLKGILICSVILMVGMVFVAQSAYATNGYFAHGFGVNDQALGGAGVALPQDSLDAAVNPANMAFLGKRYDLGIAFFNPNRQYTVNGNPSGFPGTFGLAPGTVKSDSEWFVIPSFGANWVIDENSSFGLSIFGNGGMNTDYPTNTFGGSTPTGVDLMQLFIAPTYARKLAPQHAIGITPILAYQRFEANGLQAFGGFSSDPNNLTNNGHDDSYGYGARIGYQGEIVPSLNLGLAYQTRIYMSELDKYKGLFAEQGDFDIPSNWTVGLAFKATPELAFVFDVQRINYSEVKSINNPLIPNIQTSPLGSDGGAGFGWKDMTIYKIGVQWKSSKEWTWRAGYSTGNQPIPESEVLFNILAPGVIEQHVTAGFTRATADNQDLNFALTRALSHSIAGPNPLEAPGQQTIELKMDQWQIAASYSWKF
jgi:long-chain fatty acid transport protein